MLWSQFKRTANRPVTEPIPTIRMILVMEVAAQMPWVRLAHDIGIR
jgi:hypothetical protein